MQEQSTTTVRRGLLAFLVCYMPLSRFVRGTFGSLARPQAAEALAHTCTQHYGYDRWRRSLLSRLRAATCSEQPTRAFFVPG